MIYSNPALLPAPLGAYSHIATGAGQLVSIAGQVGVQSDGELAGDGGCAAQVVQTFENLRLALDSQGLAPGDLFQLTTYLISADDIPAFFEARTTVFADMFPDGRYPPNTLLVIDRLVQPELLVEMSALAVTLS